MDLGLFDLREVLLWFSFDLLLATSAADTDLRRRFFGTFHRLSADWAFAVFSCCKLFQSVQDITIKFSLTFAAAKLHFDAGGFALCIDGFPFDWALGIDGTSSKSSGNAENEAQTEN